jgi:hypothetical protein
MLIPNVSLSVAAGMRVARASNAALRPRMARIPFSAILPASLPASRPRPGRGLGKSDAASRQGAAVEPLVDLLLSGVGERAFLVVEPLEEGNGGVDPSANDASACVCEAVTAFGPTAGPPQQVPVGVGVQELAMALRKRRHDLGEPDRDPRQRLVALWQRADVHEHVAQRVDLGRGDDRVECFVGGLDPRDGEFPQYLRSAVVPAEPLDHRAGTINLCQKVDQRLQEHRDRTVRAGELLV